MLNSATAVDISQDWLSAAGVQQRFMQCQRPDSGAFDYSARCRQTWELGGDCYDFALLPDGRLALTIGDASGKSLAAALLISNALSSLRTAVLCTGNHGAETLKVVNRQVYASSPEGRYATLFCAVFDPSTRVLTYINAGHNPPMVLHQNGQVAWLETGGAPAGMFPDWPYQEGVVQLSPGDLLIAYTDGVIEALNPDGKEWGVEGLRKAAAASNAQSAGDIVDAVFTSMNEFSRGCQTDDATVAVLRVL